MAERTEHDVTMQPVRIVEEDKTRVYALDLAVRTTAARYGSDGNRNVPAGIVAEATLEIADAYLAWLKPERPQDQ